MQEEREEWEILLEGFVKTAEENLEKDGIHINRRVWPFAPHRMENMRGSGSFVCNPMTGMDDDDNWEGMTECETMLLACSDRPQAMVNRMPAIVPTLATGAMIVLEKEVSLATVKGLS